MQSKTGERAHVRIVSLCIGPGRPSVGTWRLTGPQVVTNGFCLYLLTPYRRGDVNMASAWDCSRNDVIEGLAVLAAAVAVWLIGAGWPDLIIAVVLLLMFFRSALRVFRMAWRARSRSRVRNTATGPLKRVRSDSARWFLYVWNQVGNDGVARNKSPATQDVRKSYGGSGGIRTHGGIATTPVFKTGALNRSATLPSDCCAPRSRGAHSLTPARRRARVVCVRACPCRLRSSWTRPSQRPAGMARECRRTAGARIRPGPARARLGSR